MVGIPTVYYYFTTFKLIFILHTTERSKECRSSLNGNHPPMKSTSRTRNRTNKKLNKSEEAEATVLRRSPRKIMADGHSNECLALATEKVAEDKRSKVKYCPSSVQNNCERTGNNYPVELERASTCKDSEVLMDDCPARRSQSKNKVTVDSKRHRPPRDDVNVSASAGRKRGRRKSSQDDLKTLTSAHREGAVSNGLSAQCSNGDIHVSSQRKRPPKRKLLDEGTEYKKTSSKNSKPSSQDGVAHKSGRSVHRSVNSNFSSKRMLANAHKDSEQMKEVGTNGENIVCGGLGTVDAVGTGYCESSNHSSDDELMEEPFSPSQESSKF